MLIKNTSNVPKGFFVGNTNHQLNPGESITLPDTDFPVLKEIVKGSPGLSLELEDAEVVQEMAGSTNINNTKFVSPSGSNETGDGSIGKPFLTVKAAYDSILDASPTKRYIILVQPGSYTEVGMTLKANVFLVGLGNDWYPTRITNSGDWTLDSTWSPAGDHRSGIFNINIRNLVNLNYNTHASNEGKFYIRNSQITFGLNMNNQSAINQTEITESDFFAACNLTGGNNMLRGCRFNAGNFNVTANGNTICAVRSTMFNGQQNYNGAGGNNLTLYLMANTSYSVLNLIGANLTCFADDVSLPPKENVSILSGAGLNRRTDAFFTKYAPTTNGHWPVVPGTVQAALDALAAKSTVGNTASRPVGTSVGTQYFDTTLVKPIWSNGSGGWVDATGTLI